MYKNVFVSESCVLQNKKPFYVGKNISLLFFFSESRLQLQLYLILQKDSKTDLKINISIYKLFFKAITEFFLALKHNGIHQRKYLVYLIRLLKQCFSSDYTLVNSDQISFLFSHSSKSFRFRIILALKFLVTTQVENNHSFDTCSFVVLIVYTCIKQYPDYGV